MSRTTKDVSGVLRGAQLVLDNIIQLQSNDLHRYWRNSSVRQLTVDRLKTSGNKNRLTVIPPSQILESVVDGVDRCRTVVLGARKYLFEVPTHQPKPSSKHTFSGQTSSKFNQQKTIIVEQQPQISDPQTVHLDQKQTEQSEIHLTSSDRVLIQKLEMEHRNKLQTSANDVEEVFIEKPPLAPSRNHTGVKAVPNPKSKQTLSANAKQRKVPSSRIGRMVSFGSLAAGLGIGTAAEYARRTLGFSENADPATLFLNPANLDRIVDTLCKVRGAALKLGQIISIQDDKTISPELVAAFERVRKSADFMPDWQVEHVMTLELGGNWRQRLFVEFEMRPFAAASIGQVHRAVTVAGNYPVAVKIQYPGVARGIESDIDNLGAILKLWNVFPKGMFLDNLMKVAKRELSWEVDYIREADCTRNFQRLLASHPDYYVPNVVDELTTKQVFTTELLTGIPVDQCFDLPIEDRQFISEKILDLCMLEILEFGYMQTDPNWANFLYDPYTKRILLLDFGASREYAKTFLDQYVRILKAACDGDRDTVLLVSRHLGFLTGYETKLMEEAHVDAVMILGEVFRCPDKFDFAAQDMTERIQNLVPTMISHRLCPPPEEVYSLHRKLSGVFLLCAKMKASIACRDRFLQLYQNYLEKSQ